ncbi:unnamed protein product, partial [Menidia menidia]
MQGDGLPGYYRVMVYLGPTRGWSTWILQGHFDGEDQKRLHSCPQCRKIFIPRPVLEKSTMLAALVEQLKKTGLQPAPADDCYAGPEDVACDVCSGRKLRASKSCLVCVASYCEEHLQPHYDYCMSCIKGHFDGEDQKRLHSCPQCRKSFIPRPVLEKNTMLAALVEQLKKTGLRAAPADDCYAGPEDVACDVCSGRKLRAIKSCLVCVASYSHFDGEDQKRLHSCPQCRESFIPRPVLVRNTMLASLVEQLKKTGLQPAPADHCYAGLEDVACDFCSGRKLRASKSCLVCVASYCEEHLQPHYESPPFKKHKLVEPCKKLQENICSVHDEVKKLFCRTDQKSICVVCTLDEHKGHHTVSAAAERTERQRELEGRRQQIQQRIQDTQKDVDLLQQEVEAIDQSADKTVEDSGKIFTQLIRLIQKKRSDVEQQVRSQQRTAVSGVKELQQKLQQEITELQRKDAELQKLSHTEDHIQFLTSCPSLPALGESTHSSSIRDQKGVHSCPQCRKSFTPRPVLEKNTMLASLVQQLKKTGLQPAPADHCYAGLEDVACDVCSGRKLRAIKSCLSCVASYCEEHLQPHYESPPLKKHKLVEPSKKLQENICSVHDEVKKLFCRTDQKSICLVCAMDEHKGHHTVSVAAERTERQRELEGRRKQIQQGIQDKQRDVKRLQQEVEAIDQSADKTVEESEKTFTELIRLIQNRRSDVEQQVRSQQQTAVRGVKELQQKLQQEITELQRKDAELQQLSHTEDHIQFLTSCPSLPALGESTHSSSIRE